MNKDTFWYAPLVHVCTAFDTFARFFHGYELDLDKIPDNGPALLILYHGLSHTFTKLNHK